MGSGLPLGEQCIWGKVDEDMGCREGFLRAACSVNAQHRDETRCQLTLCSL